MAQEWSYTWTHRTVQLDILIFLVAMTLTPTKTREQIVVTALARYHQGRRTGFTDLDPHPEWFHSLWLIHIIMLLVTHEKAAWYSHIFFPVSNGWESSPISSISGSQTTLIRSDLRCPLQTHASPVFVKWIWLYHYHFFRQKQPAFIPLLEKTLWLHKITKWNQLNSASIGWLARFDHVDSIWLEYKVGPPVINWFLNPCNYRCVHHKSSCKPIFLRSNSQSNSPFFNGFSWIFPAFLGEC